MFTFVSFLKFGETVFCFCFKCHESQQKINWDRFKTRQKKKLRCIEIRMAPLEIIVKVWAYKERGKESTVFSKFTESQQNKDTVLKLRHL